MIVVDVGCMTYGEDESVHKLIDRFAPPLVFAFDPHPGVVEGLAAMNGALVVAKRAAAWMHNGTETARIDGLRTGVDTEGETLVQCFDFPEWLLALSYALPSSEQLVVKLDAEGAEYPLLAELARRGLDERLALVLVEWHPPEKAHGLYMEQRPVLRCPVEEWT